MHIISSITGKAISDRKSVLASVVSHDLFTSVPEACLTASGLTVTLNYASQMDWSNILYLGQCKGESSYNEVVKANARNIHSR